MRSHRAGRYSVTRENERRATTSVLTGLRSAYANAREKSPIRVGINLHAFNAFVVHADVVPVKKADVGQVFSDDPLDFLIRFFALFHIKFPSCKIDQLIDTG